MEINPRHPIVTKLNELVQAEDEGETVKDLGFLLYDTSLLTSGFQLEDPKGFAGRMFRLMQSGLDIDSLDLEAEVEVPDEPEEEEEEEEDEDEESLDDDEEEEEEGDDAADASAAKEEL